MIVQGRQKPYSSKRRFYFGAYVLVYTDTTNNMKSRSIQGIYLKKINDSGGY